MSRYRVSLCDTSRYDFEVDAENLQAAEQAAIQRWEELEPDLPPELDLCYVDGSIEVENIEIVAAGEVV